MTSHDEILERMSGANPLPDVDMITDGQLAELTLQVEQARRAEGSGAQTLELAPLTPKVRWRRPAIAFAAATLTAGAVVGVVSLATGGESDVADLPSTTTMASTITTTTPPTDVTSEDWNPVLAGITAGPAPEAAVCPPGTSPTAPGPTDQDRPAVGSPGLLSAAFDHHLGKVIYVDGAAATWVFDVCTNTWSKLQPSGVPTGNISGGLVYDIDSDVTVAIESDEIFIYDAAANTWERRINTSDTGGIGAVYDPVSGLIITSSPVRPIPGEVDPDAWIMQAYDVDTDTWYHLGVVPLPRETPCCTGIDLLGYSAELDRLILTTYVDEGEATLLLDPRTGELTTHTIPTPVVNLIWPGRSYGLGDTVYVEADAQVEDGRWNTVLCGFDPSQITWSRCYAAPEEFPALKHRQFNAIVGDPVNDRLLLLGGSYFSSTPSGTNDVWAIDLATGEWTEVVAPTGLHP